MTTFAQFWGRNQPSADQVVDIAVGTDVPEAFMFHVNGTPEECATYISGILDRAARHARAYRNREVVAYTIGEQAQDGTTPVLFVAVGSSGEYGGRTWTAA
jgi:hypothetical protein